MEADCTFYSNVETPVVTTLATFFQGVNTVIQSYNYDAQPNRFSKLSHKRWRQFTDVNLQAQFNLIYLFFPQLLSAANQQDDGIGGDRSVLFVSVSVGLDLGLQQRDELNSIN